MERNNDREQAVWQRVCRNQPELTDEAELIRLCAQSAAALRALAARSVARRREQLSALAAAAQETAACLRGMLNFRGEPAPAIRLTGGGEESGARVLAQCIRRSQICQLGFASRTAEPEFGAVWQALSLQESQYTAALLSMLGEAKI